MASKQHAYLIFVVFLEVFIDNTQILNGFVILSRNDYNSVPLKSVILRKFSGVT